MCPTAAVITKTIVPQIVFLFIITEILLNACNTAFGWLTIF